MAHRASGLAAAVLRPLVTVRRAPVRAAVQVDMVLRAPRVQVDRVLVDQVKAPAAIMARAPADQADRHVPEVPEVGLAPGVRVVREVMVLRAQVAHRAREGQEALVVSDLARVALAQRLVPCLLWNRAEPTKAPNGRSRRSQSAGPKEKPARPARRKRLRRVISMSWISSKRMWARLALATVTGEEIDSFGPMRQLQSSTFRMKIRKRHAQRRLVAIGARRDAKIKPLYRLPQWSSRAKSPVGRSRWLMG